MENLMYIFSNILIPLIVAVLTVLLTVYFNEKVKKAKVLIIYNKKENVNIIKEKNESIYLMCKENLKLENEFKKFLKENEFFSTYHFKKLLLKTYNIYKNKIYKEDKICIDNEKNEICKMINYFKNNNEFISYIKKYEVFFLNSFWNIKLINIGKTEVYDLKIEFNNDISKSEVIEKDILKRSEYITLNINYFDRGIRINTFDFGYDIPFDFGYSKYTKMIFYSIDKRKYNKKDEIILKFSYLDSKAKRYELYLCSKEINIK